MKKYLEVAKYSIKQKLVFKTDYITSLLSYAIHIFVFNALWDYILQGKEVVGFTKQTLIWYIIMTELVVSATYRSYQKVSEMVKNGDIANLLSKPIDFIKFQFMEDSAMIIRLFVNSIFAIILGLTFAGPIQVSIGTIVLTAIAVIIGCITGMFIQLFVGVVAMLTEENKGYWLVLQKMSFLLVFTPIEFYTKPIQILFYCLPTTYFVFAPARILIGTSIKQSIILLGLEILCLAFWIIATKLVYERGVKKINVNGG